MKSRYWLCVFIIVFLPAVSKDSDEPFLDPAEDNPVESLRRVARVMKRLSSEELEVDELAELQGKLMEQPSK